MRNLMKNIPNVITCLNLFSGSLACVLAMERNYTGAFVFIVFAAVFDFLDGFAARLLKAYSPMGKELDSLADVISFGLAPGLLVFSFLQKTGEISMTGMNIHFLGFLIPIFAAIRLAKFNIDTRQTNSFLGLPVPANALFWGALIPTLNAVLWKNEPEVFPISIYIRKLEVLSANDLLPGIIIFSFVVVFCLLMVSELPMFSLKFKNYGWRGNELQYSLIIITLLLITFFNIFGISLSILAYILISTFNNARKRD
ncbi:MAG: CDP-diacylglycerol--serine O-phosphatidyltransferase [Dysgonamonadaceae bacterium]|jgi:CDP-diacylglycerol--serine O-phosphatidyltransferase|nr:CDP-diacylglycerol--serine O-phosphatidyltransferase [Dysgonamonadaceae bacterium]